MQTCMSKNVVNCNSVTVELPYCDNREMYIMNTAASRNDSNHRSSTPASGTAHHGRPYQNLGSWISLRSYTIVDATGYSQ